MNPRGQRIGSRETAQGSREAMRAQAGLLLGITGGQAQGKRRRGLPASFQREGPAGTVQVFGLLVSPLVPARPFDGNPLWSQPLRAFEAQAVFHEHGLIGRPLLSSTGQQAGLRVASDEPTKPGMQRDLHAIEGRSLMLLSPDVGPGAQPPLDLSHCFFLGYCLPFSYDPRSLGSVFGLNETTA